MLGVGFSSTEKERLTDEWTDGQTDVNYSPQFTGRRERGCRGESRTCVSVKNVIILIDTIA